MVNQIAVYQILLLLRFMYIQNQDFHRYKIRIYINRILVVPKTYLIPFILHISCLLFQRLLLFDIERKN